MTEVLVLDVVLGLVLIAYVVYGFGNGLSRSIFVIAGVIAGLVAAYFIVPLVAGWVSWQIARPFVTVIVALGFIALGHAAGSAIGRAVRRNIERGPLSGIDRVFGAVLTGVAAALAISVVAFSVTQLGVPTLSKAISGSAVVRTINSLTPDPVEAFIAHVRGYVIDTSLPIISDAIDGPDPVIPQIDTGSEALNAAAQSVVRITGNAYACGLAQAGSGFVVSDDRIVTNAHVVAGVTEPVIEAANGQTLTGSIVYFDAVDDLAVISVAGLDASPLVLGDSITVGADAAVQGFPYGGPFSSGAAAVMDLRTAPVKDIYDASTSQREVYTLAADVRPGNSGGPLLTLDGQVAGVVFAKSGDRENVGYAMTMTELDPVVGMVAELTAAVSTGECIAEE